MTRSRRSRRFLVWFLALALFGTGGVLGGYLAKNQDWLRSLLARDPASVERLAPGANRRAEQDFTFQNTRFAEALWSDPEQTWTQIPTLLHMAEFRAIRIAEWQGRGGAVETVGEAVLVASAQGDLWVHRPGADPRVLKLDLDLGLDRIGKTEMTRDTTFPKQFVRVLDLLVRDVSPGGLEVLVSHQTVLDECMAVAVSRFVLSVRLDAVVQPPEVVFTALPCLPPYPEDARAAFNWRGAEAGGRLVVAPGENSVFLSLGDHGWDGVDAPLLDDASPYGTILELDLDTGTATTVAKGLRNPQGLALDTDGRLWETEHGPEGGDELNLIVPGQDYGWPQVSLGIRYYDRPWPPNPEQGRHAGFAAPMHAWVPSIGVSQLLELSPDQFPLWNDDLLVASLRAGTLFRLRLDGDRVVYSEALPIGLRLRDMAAFGDGRVAILTDNNLLLIMGNAARGDRRDWIDAVEPEPITGADLVLQGTCGSCHALGEQTNSVGPHLVGIVGRPIAAADGFAYSSGLASASGDWTEENLREFLKNPQDSFGSVMTNQWLTDREIELILTALKRL